MNQPQYGVEEMTVIDLKKKRVYYERLLDGKDKKDFRIYRDMLWHIKEELKRREVKC